MTRDEFLSWAKRFPDALILLGSDGKVLACNGVLLELFGQDEKTVLQQSVFDWATDSEEKVRYALRLWSGSGQMINAPVRFVVPGVGAVRCEGAVLERATDEAPAILIIRVKRSYESIERFVVLNRTVNELHKEVRARMASEAEIRKQREWLHVTLSSIGDAVIATDVKGRIEFLNPVAEQLTGWTTAEAFGQPMTTIFSIFNEQTGMPAENPVERVLRDGLTVGLANHTVLRSRNGTEFPIEDSAAPIRNGYGGLIGVVLVFHDVSDKKEDRRMIERARDEALAASRSKDDFLAALSHELRTPLNPVLLISTEAAANLSLPDEVRRDFEMIAKNSLLEARLIDDLLDLTRITRNKLSLELGRVEVHAILQDAISIVESDREAKQQTLEVEFMAQDHTVHGDPARLQQVFWNVLKNAVKFTSAHGYIRLTTRTSGTRELVVEISDTGMGMTEAEIDLAFSAFLQGDHATKAGRHQFGGLGLGLAISRSLVELHGGTIRAHSPGREKGSTFTIVLPTIAAAVAPPHAAVPADNVRAAGRGRRLLLVEDHEPTRQTLTHLLQRRGYEVTACVCAGDALAAARTGSFELVISDIGLPDRNGFELMRELHRLHGLPGIAITGYGTDNDIANSRAAGFVAHLTKPVNVRSLDTALQAFDAHNLNGSSSRESR